MQNERDVTPPAQSGPNKTDNADGESGAKDSTNGTSTHDTAGTGMFWETLEASGTTAPQSGMTELPPLLDSMGGDTSGTSSSTSSAGHNNRADTKDIPRSTAPTSSLSAEDASLLLRLLQSQAASVAPQGKRPWRKRHPFLFWVVLIVLVLVLLQVIGAIWAAVDRSGVLSSPRIGVLNVEGMIMDSTASVEWCRRLEYDDSVKGVLVRINSPGGAVVPSQEIYTAVQRLARKKPVVVSMGAVAASGGYYIALGADYIVAGPSSLTGSIGVKMELAEAKQLLDTLGIHSQGLASGPMKEAGTFYRPMRPDERLYLQGLVDDMYLTFIEDVAKSRKLSLTAVRSFADGRAYTGRQALSLKLVDALGDADFALAELKQRAGIKGTAEIIAGPEEERSLLLRLFSAALEDFSKARNEALHSAPAFYY